MFANWNLKRNKRPAWYIIIMVRLAYVLIQIKLSLNMHKEINNSSEQKSLQESGVSCKVVNHVECTDSSSNI